MAADRAPVRREGHQVARIDEKLDRRVRLDVVDAVLQHDPARTGAIDVDETFRAGDFRNR